MALLCLPGQQDGNGDSGSPQPYISSGTWSLLGVNTPKPLTDPKSQAASVEDFKELFRKVM